MVAGIDNIKVSFASCCDPVYGDPIIGYITRGNGISIHRSNCHNLAMMEDRCVEVSWTNKPNSKYETDLILYSNTNENKLADIIKISSTLDVNIDAVKVITKGSTNVYEMTSYVRNLYHLNKLLKKKKKEPYIDNVERLIQ